MIRRPPRATLTDTRFPHTTLCRAEERHRVGRRPFTLPPRAIPADPSRQGQPHQRGPVMKMHDRDRPLAAPAENADAAIGQLPLDRSQREAAVDSVEHAMKYPRGRPRQQPRQPPTRAKCPVRAQQFVAAPGTDMRVHRSEEHTSELQSLMRISYAVFCLKKKKQKQQLTTRDNTQ